MSDAFDTIKSDLTMAEKILAAMAPYLALIPGYAAVAPYFALIPIIIMAVAKVQEITGASRATAIAAVSDHLTPGAPNSPALTTAQPAATVSVDVKTDVQTAS